MKKNTINTDKPLRNKIAVVTGASTGIGKAIALEVAKEGAKVILVSRTQNKLQEIANQIIEFGGEAIVISADLSDQGEIQRLVESIMKVVKRVDILYNVAGVWHNDKKAFYGQRLDEISLHQFNEVMNVNLIAPMMMARSLVKLMAPNKSGKIINISGTFSNGGAKWLHYYVSKRAIEDFTIGLADELREFEIQVNCISPSDVASQAYLHFFPDDAKTALKPEEVAKVATWLAKEEANNISGQVIVVKSKMDYSPIL